jgi:hypothetical protein
MNKERADRISGLYRYSLLAIATLHIALYLVVVVARIRYPFELEWMEGGALDQVRRMLSGQRLYAQPSLEYVSFVYTPLYFGLSALVSSIAGVSFAALRLVSFVSSLGCLSTIFLLVRRDTGSAFSGIVASCLFAATFRTGGAWFDVARPDSLFLFFLLAALYVLRFGTSVKSHALAGVFVALSFLTKQTALIASLPMMLYSIVLKPRRGLSFVGSALTIIAASTLVLNHMYDGWYKYYVLDLPAQHSIDSAMIAGFWTKDILAPLGIALAMALFYLLIAFQNSADRSRLIYPVAATGMLGLSWIAKSNLGGYDNVLLPAYAIMSILFGLAVHTILEFIAGAPRIRQRLMEIYVYLICIIQFAALIYNPVHQIPTRSDLEAGQRLVDTIRQVQGEVLVPHHSYLTVLARKNGYAHWVAVEELLGAFGGGETEAGALFIGQMKEAIRERRFAAIILDSYPIRTDIMQEIERYYVGLGPVFDDGTVFWPITGKPTRPEVMYVPKSADTL